MNQTAAQYSTMTGDVREIITATYYDEVAVGPSTLLAETSLFGNEAKPREARNFSLPSTLDKKFTVTHIFALHNFLFTLGDAAHAPTELQRFEADSFLKVKIQDVSYPEFPLCLLTGVKNVAGATAVNQQSQFIWMFPLEEGSYLEIPPAGTAEFTFVPARSLTTAATAVTNPILPGRGFASNEAFRIKFFLHGYLDRPG